LTVPTETVVDQLLHDPPDVHEFAGWSGRLAAPVCVWKVIVTEAASVRLLVLAETVNVEFLVAEFGTGSPYASVATTTVAFAAADLTKIATAPWTLGPTTSTHLCLGVQIATPADPFVAPGLNGNTPGWPSTDLMVINDNNKAQRNMGLSTTPARGVGASDCYFAIVRNAATFPRDVELHYDESLGTLTDPKFQIRLVE